MNPVSLFAHRAPPTVFYTDREEFVRKNLDAVMAFPGFLKGKRRVRKKKAQRFLRERAYWRHLAALLAAPIMRHFDFPSLARRMFVVEQLPDLPSAVFDRPDLLIG